MAAEPLTTVRDWLIQSLPGLGTPVVIFAKQGPLTRSDEPRPALPYTELFLASSRSLIGDLGIDTTDEVDPGDASQVLEKANIPYIGTVRVTFFSDTAAADVESLHATRNDPANLALFESRNVQVGEPANILDLSVQRSVSWEPAVQDDYLVNYRVQESYGVEFVDTYEAVLP